MMSESAPAKPLEQGRYPHEEDTSVSRKPYVIFCVAFIATLLVIGVALRGLQVYLLDTLPRAKAPPLERAWQPPPAPQLQGTRVHPTAPHQDLEVYLKAKREQLQSYGWVDRKEGIARIPIDRAMALIVERGLPTRSPPTSGPASSRPATEPGDTTIGR